jgi:hypothetical protein
VFSQAASDIAASSEAQGVDRQSAQSGEVGRAVAGADLAVVFGEDDVADPVQAGLDFQCPRTQVASSAASAWRASRLVMA